MKTAVFILALPITLVAGESCQTVNNFTYCSDNYSSQRIGNFTFGSDGSSTQRIGNTLIITPATKPLFQQTNKRNSIIEAERRKFFNPEE